MSNRNQVGAESDLDQRVLEKIPTTRLPRLRSVLQALVAPQALRLMFFSCAAVLVTVSKNELRAREEPLLGRKLVLCFPFEEPEVRRTSLSFLSRLLECDVRTDQFLLPPAVIDLKSYKKRA